MRVGAGKRLVGPGRVLAVTAVAALAALAGTSPAQAGQGSAATPSDPAPTGTSSGTAGSGTSTAGTRGAPVVAGQYVVVYRRGRHLSGGQLRADAVRTMHSYSHALSGFAARLTRAQVATLAKDPAVARIVPDQVLSIDSTQLNPPWGLDRIDQPALPVDNTFTPYGDGSGVTVYVLDTGIRATHRDFGGRVSGGVNEVPGSNNVVDPAATGDCNGHGTHVAGSIGGAGYGVAKAVTLVPVRVLGCDGSGTLSAVIAGLDWVAANHAPVSVANLSLGGSLDSTLDSAVQAAIASGVTVSVAAGNDGQDACQQSPADVPEAVTVGATDPDDQAADYSNYGSCVDLYAPGSDVTSDWYSSDTAVMTLDGTSMATAYTSGVLALLAQANPGDTPAQLRDLLVNSAAAGRLGGMLSGDPNKLLQAPADPSLAADQTPPAITGLPTAVRGNLATATIVATDSGSGIKGYSYLWTRQPGPAAPGAVDTFVDTLLPSIGSRLPDGRWYLRVRAEDYAGNWSGVAWSGPYLVDVNPPQLLRLRVRVAAPTRYAVTPVAVDPGSGVKGYLVVWNHQRTGLAGQVSFLAAGTVLSPRLGSGVWYVHVRALDRAGHASGWSTAGPVRAPARFIPGRVLPGARCSTSQHLVYARGAFGGVFRCAQADPGGLRWRVV